MPAHQVKATCAGLVNSPGSPNAATASSSSALTKAGTGDTDVDGLAAASAARLANIGTVPVSKARNSRTVCGGFFRAAVPRSRAATTSFGRSASSCTRNWSG
jgi:hypothetical protein